MLIPVTIPPGVYRNGTYYDRQNRWADANLVRWESGSARPIGGWELRRGTGGALLENMTFAGGGPVRDAFSWSDNSGNPAAVWGSSHGVKLLRNSGVVNDITPAGYTNGPVEPTTELGYGQGFYGLGLYGIRQSYAGVQPTAVARWVFSNWGEDIIYKRSDVYSDVYVYASATETVSVIATPVLFKSVNVTPQRFLMCINSPDDPRQVVWSDREDYGVFTPALTNEAGSQTLETKGQLVAQGTVQGQPFILSSSDAFTGVYRGPPLVYGFNKIGANCGPINEKAVVFTDDFAMWLGSRSFWLFDGASVKEVPCDLLDFLQEDISFTNISKIHVVLSSQFNEIMWFYQSVNSDLVDSYIMFDYTDGYWSKGRLDRTAGIDVNPFVDPVYVDAAGTLYNHELKKTFAPGAFLESGPLQIEAGSNNMAVKAIYPDGASTGALKFTLLGKQMPEQPNEVVFGPYFSDDVSKPVNTRALARHLRLRVESAGIAWEWGRTPRFEIAAGGRR